MKLPMRLARTVMVSPHRQEEGQDIIEYALILPFLLLLTFSIIEGGLLISRYNTVANAAREGARAGVVAIQASTCAKPDCLAEATAKAKAAAMALAVGIDGATVTAAATSSTITVTVDYNAALITGPVIQALGGTNTIALSAQSVMQRE